MANGDVVCIFAEGGITRTGFLLPFQRGFEQIVKKYPTPIVPMCLDHVWGSIFSYHEGRFFWKMPERIPRHVYVNFGTPMPPESDAFTVRSAAAKAVRRFGHSPHEGSPPGASPVRAAWRAGTPFALA